MGRHTGTTSTPSRSRGGHRTHARHGGAVPATTRILDAVADGLGAAGDALQVRARRAGISTAALRPAGVVASSAVVLGGALGGVVALTTQVPSAQAAEIAPASSVVAPAEVAPLPAADAQVLVDGNAVEIDPNAATLGDALRDAGVVVHADDQVSAELAGAVPAEPVTISRVTTQTVTDQQVEAHGSSEVPDPNLPKGERRVTTAGVDGVTNVVSSVTLADGAETGRQEIARVTVSTKVDEVVAVGTKEAPAPAPVAPAAPSAPAEQQAPAASSSSTPGGAKAIAADMVAARGWNSQQMQCLDNLWERESNWSTTADNPTSSAYGIPQALPGSKMASAGADWRTNPATQITWGLGYIADRYGTPCAAWGHSEARGWY